MNYSPFLLRSLFLAYLIKISRAVDHHVHCKQLWKRLVFPPLTITNVCKKNDYKLTSSGKILAF